MQYYKKTNLSITLLLGSFALCISYALWYQVSKHMHLITTVTLPVAWYGQHKNIFSTKNPTNITVTLAGKRSDIIRYLSHAKVHINTSHSSCDTSFSYKIKAEDLLLPNTIKLLYSNPTSFTIT